MSTTIRRTVLAAAGTALSGALVLGAGASATAEPAQAPAGQPYIHIATPELGTGGTYVSGPDGIVSLGLRDLSEDVEVFAEECGGPDLGDVVRFPAGDSTTRALGSDVAPGTCFVLLLRLVDPGEPVVIEGTLSY